MIDKDINIEIDGKVVNVSQKKLRAVIAFFAVEKQVSREELAKVFFNGNRSNIRNSIYMINKQLNLDFIVNKDRNNLVINNRFDLNIEHGSNFLSELNLKNNEFGVWKLNQSSSNDYYLNNEDLNKVYISLCSDKLEHFRIVGKSGVGKTDFCNRLSSKCDEDVIRVLCNESESVFSLNIIYIIVEYLSARFSPSIMNVFNDIRYNNIRAFEDENSLLNLYYTPVEELILNIFETQIHKKTVVFIEDVEYIDAVSLAIINKIINRKNSLVTFVVTYNTDSNRELDFSDNFNLVLLKDFSKVELKLYLECHYSNLIDKLDLIYEYGQGNQFFSQLAINNILQNNQVSIVPDSYEALFTNMSSDELNVLKLASCFSFACRVSQALEILLINEDVVDKVVESGLMYYRLVKGCKYIMFSNHQMKNYIYQQMDEKKRCQFHYIIGKIYEQKREVGNIKQVYDIYFHYKQSADIIKTFEYQVKYLSIVSSYMFSLFPVTNKFGFVTDFTSTSEDIESVIKEIDNSISDNIIINSSVDILIDYYTLRNRYSVIIGEVDKVQSNILKQIECCKQKQDLHELIKSYYIMIHYSLNFADYEAIDEYLDKIYAIKINGDIALAKRIEGYNWYLKNNLDRSAFLLNEAISLSKELSKEVAEANILACYINLGEVYIVSGDYRRAMLDINRGKKIVADSLHFISGSVLLDLYSAIINYKLGNLNLALEDINLTLEYYDKNNLCWKRTICYIVAKYIYDSVGLDSTRFVSEIKASKIKYHNNYEKWVYNNYLTNSKI